MKNMKTVLAVDLLTRRNVTFVRYLLQNFRLIMFYSADWKEMFGDQIIFVEELMKDSIPDIKKDFDWEFYQYARFLEQQLYDYLPNDRKELQNLSLTEYQKEYDKSYASFERGQLFKLFIKRYPIDLVITNYDSLAMRRPPVIEARKAGIPTLNLEHGFFGLRMNPEYCPSGTDFDLHFISEYENFDNEYEKRIWESYAALSFQKYPINFLAFGTPNDVSIDSSITRSDASRFLGIPEEKFVVTVINSWSRMQDPSAFLYGLDYEVKIMRIFLDEYVKVCNNKNDYLVFKIHPFLRDSNALPDITRFLESEAKKRGITHLLITANDLDQVLACTNLILTYSESSVLWEAFMGNIPSVIYHHDNKKWTQERLEKANPLFEAGCVRHALLVTQIGEWISHYKVDKNYTRYKQSAIELKERLGITEVSVEDKCKRLCDWIKEKLSKQSDKQSIPAIINTKVDIGLSICVPSRQPQFANWGDIYFANSLAKSLQKMGFTTGVFFQDEWEMMQADRLIHLRGLNMLLPTEKKNCLLYIINHPELIQLDELNAYQGIVCCSQQFAEIIKPQISTLLYYIPQAGDDIHFHPHDQEKDIDILFVGNNHRAQEGRARQIIEDFLQTGLRYDCKIVGAAWHGIVPEAMILSDYVAWQELPLLYARAKIVLNDHQDTMRQYGFVNNRTFDLVMMNCFQIADNNRALDDFGITTYTNSEDLRAKITHFINNPIERERSVKIAKHLCKEMTFIIMAKKITGIMQDLGML